MKLVITAEAQNDLREIADYIAHDNPLRAVTFINEIEARLERLSFMPRAYPLLPRHETSGVRRAIFKDYLIFYRIKDDAVVVHHILHGSRDYEKMLFPDGP